MSEQPKKLDPTILSAAKRAFPQTVAAQKAAIAAEHAAEAAVEAGEAAKAAAGIIERRTIMINAAPPRAGGRKLTDARKTQYLELLRQAVTPVMAAKAVGLQSQTIRKHMREDPEFKDAVKDARADATSPIIEAMWEIALMGNFAAQKYLLENMDPENWQEPKNIKVEVSGSIESGQTSSADRVDRIRQLEERLATRLALRAAGDEIEDEAQTSSLDPEDAEIVDEDGGDRDIY